MPTDFLNAFVSVALALVGLAVIATLVSKNANTTGVLSSSFGGLATGIKAATAPVTGSIGYDFGGLTGLGSPL